MAKKYYSETQNRTPRPRSKRLRALGGGAASAGGATVVSVTGGSSEPSGDGHTHTNKPALDEISTDEERYLYLTKEDTPEDSEAAVFTKEKVKAGFADKSKEAESAKEADHATKSDEALHADEANNAKKWDGHVFDDYLDQPVRTSDEVAFNGVRTEKVESASGFEEGLLGKGFQLQQKSDGKSRLEVDELLVRMKAYFASLEIRELSYVGGNYVFSSAGSRIYYVEKVADGWKCYFYSDDGTTSTMNYWKVGDQARCQTFNIEEGTHTSASNKYYWRKVTAVGSGHIEGKKNADGSDDLTEYKWAVLSDTDFDGDDVPEPDDRIVQMGSRNIESRQGLIYLVVEGENAPAIMEYSGVGAEYPYYVLPEPTLLLSPKKNIIHGEFHSVAYGGGGSGSIDQQIQDLMNQLEEVKAQNDQKMDIWFYSHSPLPTNDNTSEVNAPASDWVTDEQKALHIHDLFYDTSRNAGSAGGRAWKWVFEDNHYFWAEVTDQDTLAALEKIADVASDGILTGGAEKSRVLVDWNACVSEYDKYVGQAEEFKKQKPELVTVTLDAYKTAFIGLGTLLNGGAAWAVSDGVPSWLVNIQEDTTIPDPENYREAWAVYYSALSALLKAITDAAKALADDAQEAADDAQETADGAVDQLENMAADNIITLQEKLTLSHLWDNVKATHTQLDAEAVKYDVAHADYDNAFNAIGTLVEKILDSTTDYTLTTSDGYTTKWSAYYTQESDLYAAIVTAAKKVADDAQKTAEDAQNTAEHRMQFFASQPTPPYNVGDMWLDSSIIKVCTKARTKSETFHSEDWKQFTDYSSVQDPRILLAAFANAYYNSYKDKLQQSGNVNIFINTAANDSPAGSIKYDAQGGSIFMCSSGTNSWVRPTSISNGTTIATTIDALYNCMGAVTLTVYSNVPATGMKQYDIVIRTVSYYDHFKKENISGKCEILMYNGTCWEVLQESVTSIIDNLGDQLRLIVFGSNGTNEVDSSGLITRTTFNELFSQKVTTDANGLITNINKSGLLTSADFSTLFSTALASDGTVVKKSEITAFVTKDENGYLQSGVKVSADQVELTGSDKISLLVKNSISNTVGANLIPNSLIGETSKEYGFAKRSVKLTSGQKYTLSANGIVPHNAFLNQMELRIYIWRYTDATDVKDDPTLRIGVDWRNSASFAIQYNLGNAQTNSAVFTPDRNGEYHICAYLYSKTEPHNGGYRDEGVTLNWIKLEKGELATEWLPGTMDELLWKNYIQNPRAIDGKFDTANSCTKATDPTFGEIVTISHNTNANWQLTFNARTGYESLTGKVVTFFCICKNDSGYEPKTGEDRKQLRFGGGDENVTALDTCFADFVDLGNGWRKYYATRYIKTGLMSNSDGTSDTKTIGVNCVMGTWKVYAVGVVLGGVCPLTQDIMNQCGMVATGIDIVNRTIELRADKVKFTSADGKVSDKISIDPTTGTLNATDAIVRGIVKSNLFFSNVKTITGTSYQIDPNTEPYNWYFVNENTSGVFVYLPKASEWDGLELNIFVKHSSWSSDKMVRVGIIAGDSLCFKENVYAVYEGGSIKAVLENCNKQFVTVNGPNSLYCPPNQVNKFKSIGGRWYAIGGLFTGE